MSTIELAGLKVHTVGCIDAAAPTALVIMLHGFGAPGDDLVSLTRDVASPRGTTFLFPEAPIDMALESPAMGASRAWWPIDVARVQVAMMSGKVDEVVKYLRPGLEPAIALISQLLIEACQRFHVDLRRTVLGGFSQGAILALEATLEEKWPLAGLVVFSATSLDGGNLVCRARPLAPMSSVVSHGQLDPILPYSRGQRLAEDLTRAGWNVDWVPFLGGHGIPPEATSAVTRLLTTQLV